MTPKLLPLLERCIEDGLARGYARAHKHTDSPNQEAILDSQYDAIKAEIWEWFDFTEQSVQDYP